MKSAQGRVNIANARLAALGDPAPNEPASVTEMRDHYRKMLDEALDEISEAQQSSLPYKDAD